jgi:uncharacterized protein
VTAEAFRITFTMITEAILYTTSADVASPLPPSQRQRATLAKPGAMFVSQPEIPVPSAVEFPFPAWATRPSESAGPPPAANGHANCAAPRDPFARLPAAPADEDDEAPF